MPLVPTRATPPHVMRNTAVFLFTLGSTQWEEVLGEESVASAKLSLLREIAFNQAPTLEIMAFEASSTPGECALKKIRHLRGHLPRKKRVCAVLPGRRYGRCARFQPTLNPCVPQRSACASPETRCPTTDPMNPSVAGVNWHLEKALFDLMINATASRAPPSSTTSRC